MSVPILLLTALGEVRARVAGLDAGADDYLPKPFAIAELCARVRALCGRGPRLRDRPLRIGPVLVDFEARRVRVNGRALELTAKELAIVELLASRGGRVVSRDALFDAIWGEAGDGQRASLDVLTGRIRRKLGPAAHLLKTIRGIGYLFRESG